MSTTARRTDAEAIAAGLRAEGLAVGVDAPFGSLTTYGVGGTAALMVEVTDAGDACAVGRVMSTHPGTDVFVLGNGSNTLVADDGFDGVVVRTRPRGTPRLSRSVSWAARSRWVRGCRCRCSHGGRWRQVPTVSSGRSGFPGLSGERCA